MPDHLPTRKRARVVDTSSTVTVDTRRGKVTLFGDKSGVEGSEYSLALKNYESQQITDPFKDASGLQSAAQSFVILEPPFDVATMLKLPNRNSTLKQCITAMVVNIESAGYQMEYVGPEGEQDSPEAVAERTRIIDLLEQPNGEYSIIELRERVRTDLESIGYAFMEVGRNVDKETSMLYHVPAHTMRRTKVDPEPTVVSRTVQRQGRSVTVNVRKHFRRYVQRVGAKYVWFKEFGDPRIIDPRTGKENPGLALEDQATEVIYVEQFAAGHAYGLPRWFNQLPAVLGSREAELTNLEFFQKNAIPAMAVLVAGGSLTKTSMESLSTGLSSVTGRDSMNRVIVIEALGDEEAADEKGRVPVPTITMQPVGKERQQDGLFLEYDKANEDKIRSSFRLPPIFLGRSADYTRATAEASVSVAEAQVFSPERNRMDELFQLRVLADAQGNAPKYWRYRTMAPRMVDQGAVAEAVKLLDSVGAITPNAAIKMANNILDADIEIITAPWGDFPFSVVRSFLERGVVLPGFEEMFGAGGTLPTADVQGALGQILAAVNALSPQDGGDGGAGTAAE